MRMSRVRYSFVRRPSFSSADIASTGVYCSLHESRLPEEDFVIFVKKMADYMNGNKKNAKIDKRKSEPRSVRCVTK